MLNREPIYCDATIKVNGNKNKFTEFTPDDIYLDDYPKELIKVKNPQLKFPLGI